MEINCYPLTVAANKESTIYIIALNGKKILPDTEFRVVYTSHDSRYLNDEHSSARYHKYESVIKSKLNADGKGVIEFTTYFASEQEHKIRIYDSDNVHKGDISVYSLEEDLYGLTPYKGDIHMHSYCSDGKESPEYVVAACREEGYDFMALTDHRQYSPSLRAIEYYKGIDTGMSLFTGEEVHSPDNDVHIIHVGGNQSVNEMFQGKNKNNFIKEVNNLIESENIQVPPNVNLFMYASSVLVFRKIKQVGGLSMFCHPFWFTGGGYHHSLSLTNQIMKQNPREFDCYELIGGYHKHEADSNTLQVAHYNELRANGIDMPVMGVSDSHGTVNADLHGWYYSIVFSEDNGFESIKKSICNFRSVAAEHMQGEIPRIYGKFRLVRYGLFLLKNYFPFHDAICKEQSKYLKIHVSDNLNENTQTLSQDEKSSIKVKIVKLSQDLKNYETILRKTN